MSFESKSVTDDAAPTSTLGAGETRQNRPINAQNVLLWPSHPPRPRKLAPWAATSWRTVRKMPMRVCLRGCLFWMAKSWRSGFPSGWPWNRRGPNIDWWALDATIVKTQDLNPHTG